MKCPYCKKEDCIPGVVYLHTDNYGGGVKHFKCNHCSNVIRAMCEREVNIFDLTKTDHESDW